MAQNRIQFQPGMSMPKFTANYGTALQCAATLLSSIYRNGLRPTVQ